MGSRTGSHQLSSGLMVSGRPEQHKEKQLTVASRAVPYTGGDVKKSGELGKMYGVDFSAGGDHHHHHHMVGPPPILKPSSRGSSSGSLRSGSNSGQMVHCTIPRKSSSSGSGPIQPTGLITSGQLSSSAGPLSSSAARAGSFKKVVYGSAVTSLSDDVRMGFKVSRVAIWVLVVVLLMGLMAGGFVMAAVKKSVILVGVGGILAPIVVILLWNYAYKERGLVGFLRRYADAELRGAVDGQFVKVTGVISVSYDKIVVM